MHSRSATANPSISSSVVSIPIDTRIRFGGDAGVPIVMASPDSENAQRFMDLASKAALKVAGNVLSKPKRSPRLAVIK